MPASDRFASTVKRSSASFDVSSAPTIIGAHALFVDTDNTIDLTNANIGYIITL